MNNYSYPFLPSNSNNLNILEELVKINETLKRIERQLQSNNKPQTYMEKDDNYYMV